MSDSIHQLVSYTEAHAWLVYLLAFVAASLESVALVGLAIPGSAIVVALGALVPSGAVGFWWLTLWSCLGAIAGDGFSYWLGRHFQDRLPGFWPFRRHPKLLGHGERFFAEHGGKSVFLSRFAPPVRGAVPLVAGMAGLAAGRFWTSCAASALLWAPAHVLLGVALGAGLTLTGLVATRLLVLTIVVLAVGWVVVKASALALRHGGHLLAAARRRLECWAADRHGWLARQIQSLLDPAQGEARTLALLGCLLLLAAWLFLGVLEDVVTGDPLVRADAAIYNLLQGLRSPSVDRLMVAITELGSGFVLWVLTVAVVLWLLWRRAWHAAAYWLAAIGLASLLGMVIKTTLHRPRPAPVSSGWDSFSFPSGHATSSAALYGFLAFLLAQGLGPKGRTAAVSAVVLLVALIGISRLYLGAHWLSDVLGGLAFGTAWIALLAGVYSIHNKVKLPAAPLAAIALATLLAAGSYKILHGMPADLERYAVHQKESSMTLADWQQGGWQRLPQRRVDLAGQLEEPLVLQWAGPLTRLQTYLTAAGWQEPAPWSAAALLDWLSDGDIPPDFPVLTRLHDGHAAALTLIHAAEGDGARQARWVLRLWPAELRLTTAAGPPRALWFGSLTQQRFRRALDLFELGFERAPKEVPWPLLEDALPGSRRATRPDSGKAGQVLLAPIP